MDDFEFLRNGLREEGFLPEHPLCGVLARLESEHRRLESERDSWRERCHIMEGERDEARARANALRVEIGQALGMSPAERVLGGHVEAAKRLRADSEWHTPILREMAMQALTMHSQHEACLQLLAVVHKDGGQHVQAQGVVAAAKAAEADVLRLRADSERLASLLGDSRTGLLLWHGTKCTMAGGPHPEKPAECSDKVCRDWAARVEYRP